MPLGRVGMELSADGGTTWKKITDHNRSEIAVDFERIEKSERMADGTLRKYIVAKKRSWSMSWDMLPTLNSVTGHIATVDGGMAGIEMENFVNDNDQALRVKIVNGDNSQTLYWGMVDSWSKEVQKRGTGIDFWSANLSIKEV